MAHLSADAERELELLEILDAFKAEPIRSIEDIPYTLEKYIAGGSQGRVARLSALRQLSDEEKITPFAMKELSKKRIVKQDYLVRSLGNELQTLFSHEEHTNVNKGVALYHSEESVHIIIELVDGQPFDSVQDRLAYALALHAPHELAALPERILRWESTASKGSFATIEDFLALSDALPQFLKSVGIVREPLLGGDLFELTLSRPNRQWSEELIAMILSQVLEGLDHLHQHGIAHRDIKNENVAVALNVSVDTFYEDEIVAEGNAGAEENDEKSSGELSDSEKSQHSSSEDEEDVDPPPSSPSTHTPRTAAPAAASIQGVTVTERAHVEIIDHGFVEAFHRKNGDGESVPVTPQDPTPFPVQLKFCGTEMYLPVEVFNDVIDQHQQQQQQQRPRIGNSIPTVQQPMQMLWNTTAQRAFQVDVYAVGIMAFALRSGCLPFKLPAASPSLRRDQRIRVLQNTLKKGPSPLPSSTSPELQDLIARLIGPAHRRPTARDALQHAFFTNNSQSQYSTSIQCGKTSA